MKKLLLLLLLSLGFIGSANANLLLYGGQNHDIFLGCYDCGHFESDSICNRFGLYGSRFNSESIWNRFGTYGSRFSSFSPWNKFSSGSDVPVLVDRSGNFYGYFPIHCFRANAFDSCRSLKSAYETLDNLNELRDDFCDK